MQGCERILFQLQPTYKVIAAAGRNTAECHIYKGRKSSDDFVQCSVSADDYERKRLRKRGKRGGNGARFPFLT